MGSTAPSLRLLLPRMGAVARNAAIVLEGHVVGTLTITARTGSSAIDVGVRTALPIDEDRFGDHRVYYLVRPASGAWPGSQTVVLTVIRAGVPPEDLEVPIDSMQDTKPPAFVSLATPRRRTISHPRGDAEVVAIDHGPFVDAFTPTVLVTLEIGTTARTGVVLANRAGTITLQPREDLGAVRTLTLADTAGNANRIEAPCRQPPPDLAVKPVTADPLEQPCSVTIVRRMIEAPAALGALGIEGKTFPVRSGHLLDTFLLVATNSDLGMGAYGPEDDDGTMLHTSFLDGPGLSDVVKRLELLVEKEATITMTLLRAHGGGTADKARLEAALRQGEWPDSGDPAEETAAFAFHLLAEARDAIQFRAGLLIEHRGALQMRPRQPSAKRVRELEKLLGAIGDASNTQLNYEMWEARGKELATEEYRRMMETELAASVRTHRDATAALEALVAKTRAEDPEALAAWVDAHDAYLAAFLDDCAEKATAVAEDTGTDGIAESVATRERAEWTEVRAGTRAFVKQNLFYVTSNDDRYRRLFGIDRKTLQDV